MIAEQRNVATMGVTVGQDSIFERKEVGAQVTALASIIIIIIIITVAAMILAGYWRPRPLPSPDLPAGLSVCHTQSLTGTLVPNCDVAPVSKQGENGMVNKPSGVEEAAAVLRSCRDVQAALDQAEAAHRSALAAYRRAGDALLGFTHAVRSWSVESDAGLRPASHRPAAISVAPKPPQAEPSHPPVMVTIGRPLRSPVWEEAQSTACWLRGTLRLGRWESER